MSSPPTGDPLPASELYRRGAPSYDVENPVTALDQLASSELAPPPAGCRLLDVGCGTGRRLPTVSAAGPSIAVGLDLVPEMLKQGARRGGLLVAAGDMRNLPVRAATFDLIWCRLAVGHVRELSAVYRELARSVAPRGTILVTDFHPSAVAAGHRRVFRTGAATVGEAEHFVHPAEDHEAAAAAQGLRLDRQADYRVGPQVQSFYDRAGMQREYAEQIGLPLVIALRFSA